MSLDFYDSNGKAYAYSDDGLHIFSFIGAPLGYISDDSIYSFSGAHIGYFNDGVLRDNRGNALLFTPESSGGPIKPVRQMKPMKGMKQMKPMKGMKQMKPIRPIKTYGWSSYELDSIWGR